MNSSTDDEKQQLSSGRDVTVRFYYTHSGMYPSKWEVRRVIVRDQKERDGGIVSLHPNKDSARAQEKLENLNLLETKITDFQTQHIFNTVELASTL